MSQVLFSKEKAVPEDTSLLSWATQLRNEICLLPWQQLQYYITWYCSELYTQVRTLGKREKKIQQHCQIVTHQCTSFDKPTNNQLNIPACQTDSHSSWNYCSLWNGEKASGCASPLTVAMTFVFSAFSFFTETLLFKTFIFMRLNEGISWKSLPDFLQ